MTTPHELTVTATNAAGESHTIHAEYRSQGDAPADAANECIIAVEKEFGREMVRVIDLDA